MLHLAIKENTKSENAPKSKKPVTKNCRDNYAQGKVCE